MVTLIQGDSYPISVQIIQDGIILSPDMLDDLEIIIPNVLSRSMKNGGLTFDSSVGFWYFRPTQQETLGANPNVYDVGIRTKYKDQPPSTKVTNIDKCRIKKGPFTEVI